VVTCWRGLTVAGVCVESTSTHSQLTTVVSDSSSSLVLVNFSYFNVSTTTAEAASSAQPPLVHATSTPILPPPLASSATRAPIGHGGDNMTTSRDVMHMHLNSTSSAAAVTWWNASDVTTSVWEVRSFESTANSTLSSVPTSSGVSPLADDVPSTDDISSRHPARFSTPSPQYFRPFAPSWSSVLAVVLCLLALVVLLVTLVVCLSRARSRHKLCWTKHRCYLPVPLFYQNGGSGVGGSRPAAVVVDRSAPSSAVTVTTGNGLSHAAPANGPELAPLTCV